MVVCKHCGEKGASTGSMSEAAHKYGPTGHKFKPVYKADPPTRKDYLARRVTHAEFYTSIATAADIPLRHHKDLDLWRGMLNNDDDALNGIDLNYWDKLAATWQASITRALKAHGDAWSLAGGVCTIKAAVRIAVDTCTSNGHA